MDHPKSLALFFQSNDTIVERIFSSNLLAQYPNCAFALGALDNPLCNNLNVTDMTFNEYDEMIKVLNGETKIEIWDERIRNLLDAHGFIDKLENKIHATLEIQAKLLAQDVSSFYYGKTTTVLCNNELDYKNYKQWFANNSNIIPIQMITVANKLIFCSCDNGVPLYMTGVEALSHSINASGARIKCISGFNNFDSINKLLLISERDNNGVNLTGPCGDSGVAGPRGVKGFYGRQGPPRISSILQYCTYCGNSDCVGECVEKLLQAHFDNMYTYKDEIIYIRSMFFYLCQKLGNFESRSHHRPESKCNSIDNRRKEEKDNILSHIRKIKYSDCAFITNNVMYSSTKTIKITLHLGFVHI